MMVGAASTVTRLTADGVCWLSDLISKGIAVNVAKGEVLDCRVVNVKNIGEEVSGAKVDEGIVESAGNVTGCAVGWSTAG